MTPEANARQTIDALLTAAGWHVCSMAEANIHASIGVAIREFPLNPGHGFADYLLYVNGKACGVIEAKKEGATLTGVEVQSAGYAQGLLTSLPAWRWPFLFESTRVETHFINGLDPQSRARSVFAFYRPEQLAQWLSYLPAQAGSSGAQEEPGIFLARIIVAEVERCLSIVHEVEAEVDINFRRAQALRQAAFAKAFAADQ